MMIIKKMLALISKFGKQGLMVIFIMILFGVSGCRSNVIDDTVIENVETNVNSDADSDMDINAKSKEEIQENISENNQKTNEYNIQIFEDRTEERTDEKAEEIMELCVDFFRKAAEENRSLDLEETKKVVNLLGENGYSAVDSDNQVDMTQTEPVLAFCENVDTKKEAEITMVEVNYMDGLIIYDLHTNDGKVDVVRDYYRYENGGMQKNASESYQADSFNYTKEGYLMFSGNCFSEEMLVLSLSGIEEHAALRVQPLDESCRELNRKYLLPVSFAMNNMFLVDWDENDFGELNFYDLFDLFYPKVYGKSLPYIADDDLSVGSVYRIPKEEFEKVIMTYFNIDSKTLQAKTIYHPEDATYEYKPRGFYETEYPEYPYSEVFDYTHNEDGTITLYANVVFPYAGISKVYEHEVVVRPLKNGRVQYVSNHIITSKNDFAETWHTPRLTEEEWNEWYGGENTSESDVLDERAISAMQEKLAETKCPVTTSQPYSNMENYEKMDVFLKACMNGKSGSVIVYEIHNNGSLGKMKFTFDGTKMSVACASFVWDNNVKPMMSYSSFYDIKEWEYTEKGWFCYELSVPEPPEVSEIMDGSCMMRIKPISDKLREFSKQCVQELGYQGNNLLCSNWDTNHLDELDYNGMFEYLYEMKYGEKFHLKNTSGGIPKEEFESLIMEYIPITAEKLRKYAAFDEEKQTYAWVRLGCFNYAPTFFGTSVPEVVDIKENDDGSTTLTVDAVCDMVICDDAIITHELTVQFAKDGSFQYLGNKILNDGIVDIPDYQYRCKK